MDKKISKRRNLIIVLALLICVLTACAGESNSELARRIHQKEKKEKKEEIKKIWKEEEDTKEIFEERRRRIVALIGDSLPEIPSANFSIKITYEEVINDGKNTEEKEKNFEQGLYDKVDVAEDNMEFYYVPKCYKGIKIKVCINNGSEEKIKRKISSLEVKQMPVEQYLRKGGEWKGIELTKDKEMEIEESSILKLKIKYLENKKRKTGYLMMYIEV